MEPHHKHARHSEHLLAPCFDLMGKALQTHDRAGLGKACLRSMVHTLESGLLAEEDIAALTAVADAAEWIRGGHPKRVCSAWGESPCSHNKSRVAIQRSECLRPPVIYRVDVAVSLRRQRHQALD